MTFEIEIQNESGYAIDEDKLRRAVLHTLQQEQAEADSALTIVFMDNAGIQALNLQFRGVDAPTDVLSFPAAPTPDIDTGEPTYLGDLIVAYPYAREQAQREEHPLDDSLSLLVVHGTLHLLGFDHDTPERRAAMWAAQEQVLRTLDISPSIVPSLEQAADHGHETD